MSPRTITAINAIDGAEALSLRVAPTPVASHRVRTAVSAFLLNCPPVPSEYDAFMVAVGEALANAIEHSHANDRIAVKATIQSDYFFVTIQDRGVGFTRDFDTTYELPPWDSERGRGFAIMKNCTDILCIDSETGKGTTVLLGIRR